MAVETYSIATDFVALTAALPDLGDLDFAINDSAITEPYQGSFMRADVVDFHFDNPLGAPDKTILDGIVAAHTGEDVQLDGGGAVSIDLVVADLESGEGAGVRIGETTFQALMHYVWRGSVQHGTPTKIKIVAKTEGGVGKQVDVRIVDLTNGSAVIGAVFFENTSFAIIDLGALSNISRGEALWEVQGKRTSGGGVRDGRLSAVTVQFDPAKVV
jgi:hypothetical protein